MAPRSYIEAMDRPTVLYILYTMVSAQQTNLLPKNALRNDAIFAQIVYRIYATTSQYLSSYGCAITMVYMYNYIDVYICMCSHIAARVQVMECEATTCTINIAMHRDVCIAACFKVCVLLFFLYINTQSRLSAEKKDYYDSKLMLHWSYICTFAGCFIGLVAFFASIITFILTLAIR